MAVIEYIQAYNLCYNSLPLQCIPVPDINKPQSTHSFAMTCIWIHLNRKAQNDNSKLQIPIPHSLKLHHEYVSLKYWNIYSGQ